MFKEMQEILKKTRFITLTVSKEGESIRVNFIPNAKEGEDASVTPLTLVGTADELDKGFCEAIQQYTEKSLSIAEQMAVYEKEAEAALEAAREAAVKKTEGKKVAGSGSTANNSKPAKPDPVKQPEEKFDDLFDI